MKDIDVAEADATEESVNWFFTPQIIGNKGWNKAPDENDKWNVETTLKAHYWVCPQVGEVNLLT